jgi:hypothetical protein
MMDLTPQWLQIRGSNAIASLQSSCPQLQGLTKSDESSILLPAELESESVTAEEKPAELEPAKELIADPEPAMTRQEIQEKLNSPHPAQVALARILARKLGYAVEEDLVLPAGEEIPSLEYLRSLLSKPTTAPKVKRLIAAHPDWGFWIDEEGEIQDF